MSDKTAILLRNPDKITLHYGNDVIYIGSWADFEQTVFYVQSDQLHKLKPYLVEGEDERKHD